MGSKVSKYDELMTSVIVGQIKHNLDVIQNTLICVPVQREVLLELVEDLYNILNDEDD